MPLVAIWRSHARTLRSARRCLLLLLQDTARRLVKLIRNYRALIIIRPLCCFVTAAAVMLIVSADLSLISALRQASIARLCAFIHSTYRYSIVRLVTTKQYLYINIVLVERTHSHKLCGNSRTLTPPPTFYLNVRSRSQTFTTIA